MKWVKFIYVAIIPAYFSLVCSCTNAASANTGGADASFSCKIDGKDFSGKGTDQILNAASVHAPGIIYFNLSPTFTGDLSSDLRQGGFGFEVPDHGTTTIRDVESSDYSIAYNPPNDPKNGYKCKEMVITVNSSATRVTGTFAGTFTNPKTHKDVAVTEGKFDIPYSTYGKR